MSSTPGTAPRARISIVVPFYDEEAAIAGFEAELGAALAALPDCDFEVVCVDDGSRDATLERLQAVAARDPRYVVVALSRNFGKEAALTAGIDHASGAAVVPMDADLQDPPELLARLIAEWRAGAEVVVAKRVDRSTDRYLKRTVAALFYRIHNRLSDIKLPENVGDFRLMDRTVVDALRRLPERQRFMKGLFAWVGFKTCSVEYRRPARAAGQSRFTGLRLWNFALDGITSFSTLPLRIWSYIGLIGALVSFSYGAYILLRTLVFGVDVPGYASLLAATLFVGSVQLLSIGILGEYIGRIYIESKQRPTYIVRSIDRRKSDA
ncbi:MAG TPA: glycosyltransferase family 2 protein [Burkholderiales bacterium]|nr:glycosyltransferase family 2 protein [Burkholderiales bacterium]